MITSAMMVNTYGIIEMKVIALAKKKLGKRYIWGATGKNTFDCSGPTYYIYGKYSIKLPRRAIAQSKVGKHISRKNLQKGDLVFFDTSKNRKGYVNHVGIYIGNNQFIHASSAKKKVVISSLHKSFYNRTYKNARRVSKNYIVSSQQQHTTSIIDYF